MSSIRYIGSKTRVVTNILSIIGKPRRNSKFVDVFSGTGIVSRTASLNGWRVLANDFLYCSKVLTQAGLISLLDTSFSSDSYYKDLINYLNGVKPLEGFIYKEYTPSGFSSNGVSRKYFTPQNGARIDGIRKEIEVLHLNNCISILEKELLIADLLEASNRIANISGTYGCFLNDWTDASLKNLELRPRSLMPEKKTFSVLNQDSFDLNSNAEDIAYLDPPYSKRQYSAYYHLLETISRGDEPEISGITGLRPWKEKSSPFCYKLYALSALIDIILRLACNDIFISYTSNGQITVEHLERTLALLGDFDTYVLGDIGKYRPNKTSSKNGHSVKEYLFHLKPDSSKTTYIQLKTEFLGFYNKWQTKNRG